jgi:hypothetical protein
MPIASKIRERLLRLLLDGPILRREVENKFDKSRRTAAKDEIALLISQGIILSTGSGRRGHPNMIQLSPTYPFNYICRLCGQTIKPKAEQWDPRDLN